MRYPVLLLAALTAACGGNPVASVTAPSGPTPVASPGSPASTPTPADATSIGPEGGTVTGLAGTAQLTIPTGALAADTRIGFASLALADPDPSLVGSFAVQITPADVRFAVPATLTLRFDPARGPSGVAPEEFGLQQQAGTLWQPIAGSSTGGEAAGQITGGGSFAVRWASPDRSCDSAESRQFDFWLGEWAYSAPNSPPGTESVTRDAGGCVISEDFRQGRYHGRSVSLFSTLDGRWHQTYVDSDGLRLVLIGSFENGRMNLEETPAHRFFWQATDPNHVRYAGESSTDGGQTWSVIPAQDALYTRR